MINYLDTFLSLLSSLYLDEHKRETAERIKFYALQKNPDIDVKLVSGYLYGEAASVELTIYRADTRSGIHILYPADQTDKFMYGLIQKEESIPESFMYVENAKQIELVIMTLYAELELVDTQPTLFKE